MTHSILVVDDELSMREFLEILLRKEGYSVDTAKHGEEALASLDRHPYDLVICDIMMPRVDGMQVLRRVKEVSPETQVIMITAFASTESAVEAMKIGAYDYITKPFKVDEIKLVIAKALEKSRLVQENTLLRQELKSRYAFENLLVGSSRPMLELYEMIRQVASTRSNVLVSGESGTGKELAAKATHYLSPRKDKPFLTVNCGAIPRELMESELFGHKKGAFTGAYQHKKGLFEMADQGTIFLDEIGELDTSIQVKLLRAIQDKTFKAVGGLEDVLVDVRVIAATNLNLEEAVAQGRFREDLYYRLNVIRLRMPPLRERKDDIPILAQHFLEVYAKELGKPIKKISSEAELKLLAYDYPGNVRELENIIERAVALEHQDVILPESLPEFLRRPEEPGAVPAAVALPEQGMNLDVTIEEIERRLITEALRRSKGVKKDAAELLGISFRSFRYRLAKLGLADDDDSQISG
jgi:two-component system response regulator PilR (NtrC family)